MTKPKVQFPDSLDEETAGNGATETAIAAAKQTRIMGMKWVKFGEGKHPAFQKVIFLRRAHSTGDEYYVGWLKGIDTELNSAVYKCVAVGLEEIQQDFTHYAIPVSPVKETLH